MVTKIAEKFCDFLGEYCSRYIWNEPQREYRHNIKLALQMKRPQINVWSSDKETIVLPYSNTQYYVYSVPLNHFAGLDVRNESGAWKPVTALLANRIQLKIHDFTGKRLVSSYVFYKSSTTDKRVIHFAVDTKMLNKVAIGQQEKLFIGVYFDSDEVNKVSIASYEVTPSNVSNVISTSNLATFKFVNGAYIKGNIGYGSILSGYPLQDGDYVEFIQDPNVLGSFSVDLSKDEDSRIYVSSNGALKNIIHIPKALNPNNYLISHDTCDFFIYPRSLKSGYKVGRYFHRAQGSEDRSFIQLTHNDFGVPTSLIDQFSEYIGADEVVIDCFIRMHSRNKTLQRDKHYLDFLYQLNDNKILDFLEGSAEVNIPFWNAKELEISNYIALLKDTSEQPLRHDLKYYTEALGYINTASKLARRIFRYKNLQSTLVGTNHIVKQQIVLPIAYQWKECVNSECKNAVSIMSDVCPECGTKQPDKKLAVNCFVNGEKLLFSNVVGVLQSCTDSDNYGMCEMEVTVNLGSMSLPDENEVIFEICEEFDFRTYIFNPTSSNNLLYVIPGEYDCYIESISQNPVNTPIGQVDKTYTKLNIAEFGAVNKRDLIVYTCPPAYYGKKIIFQTKTGLGANSRYDLQSDLSNNNNIVIVPHSDGHTVTTQTFTPSASQYQVASSTAASGVCVYKEVDGVYFDVTNSITITFTNGNPNIVFPSSLYGSSCFIVYYSPLIVTPILVDQNYIVWVNGRELVENVDYAKYQPGANMPYLYVVYGMSYLKTTDNTLELFGSNVYTVGYTFDFRTSSISINSKQHPILFFDNFTSVVSDGQQLCDYKWENGRLSNRSIIVPTRHGALYSVRSEIPKSIRSQMNPTTFNTSVEKDYLTSDIDRFNTIVDYFSSITSDDPSIYDIPVQHKVYSIYMNKVIDDILDGTLTIPPEVSTVQLKECVVDYEYLKRFDLPLEFTTTTVQTTNWDGSIVNKVTTKSVINRKFIDVYPSYTQRLVPGSSMYYVLNKLANLTIPEDTVVYTEAVDTTVDDNQGNR